jgi:hypothetical protein
MVILSLCAVNSELSAKRNGSNNQLEDSMVSNTLLPISSFSRLKSSSLDQNLSDNDSINTTSENSLVQTSFTSSSTSTTSSTTSDEENKSSAYNLEFYLSKLMEMSFSALRFIVVIIILALSVAFTVWWVLFVFKMFPSMLADLTQRIDESYGNIGVFIFIVLFFPSLLVFIIHFLNENIVLLIVALQGLLGDLIGDETVFGTIISFLKGGTLRLR